MSNICLWAYFEHINLINMLVAINIHIIIPKDFNEKTSRSIIPKGENESCQRWMEWDVLVLIFIL